MKRIFYFLAILILSFLFACSEEQPTSAELVSQSQSFSKKPKPPAPPPQEPLVLLDNENQIVTSARSGRISHPKGIVNVWTDYTITWTLEKAGWIQCVAIGDVDNDGHDELVTIHRYKTGKRNNEIFHQELLVFESGDTDEPSRVVDIMSAGIVQDIVVGELGSSNVILVGGRQYVQVFRGDNLNKLWEVNVMDPNDDFPWSVEIGNADSDSDNEVLYSSLAHGYFVVFDYPETIGKESQIPVPLAPLDRAKVADVDGDGNNEVVGGGAGSKLYIWEYENGNYNLSFESTDLGGFTQGIAAGDFDNDGIKEIAVGATFHKVYVFKYNGTTYQSVFEEPAGSVSDMVAGDSDNDGLDEIIVVGGENLLVYDWDNNYSQTYSGSLGGKDADVYVK